MSKLERITTRTESVLLPELRRQLNRNVMVAWINRDLVNRAGCDIRRSVVIWDADQDFIMALPASVTADQFIERLTPRVTAALVGIGARYWSVGIV